MKKYYAITAIALLLVATVFATQIAQKRKAEPKAPESEVEVDQVIPEGTAQGHPVATITMESGDEIKVELYPEIAPITVENFITLVDQGFYTDLIFHRVIPGFMIQGGDPNKDGSGGSDNTIKGEFVKNGVDNDISHTRGTISMARTSNPNSASSQFFIVVEDSQFLDGEYAGFGKVIEGMDIADEIANTPTGKNDKPEQAQVIKMIQMD